MTVGINMSLLLGIFSVACLIICATSENCGKLPLGTNSTNISGNDVPGIALIGLDKNNKFLPSCLGVLINSNTIITAAHCTHRIVPKQVIITRCVNVDNKCKRGIKRIIEHPQYSPLDGQQAYDIALITLDSDVSELSNFLCLPTRTHPSTEFLNVETTFVASPNIHRKGTEISGDKILSPDIDLAKAPIVKTEECEKLLKTKVPNTIFCAGGKGEEPCLGSSGAPLFVINEDNTMELLAILTSGLNSCGNSEAPSLYSNVGAHRSWIQSHLSI